MSEPTFTPLESKIIGPLFIIHSNDGGKNLADEAIAQHLGTKIMTPTRRYETLSRPSEHIFKAIRGLVYGTNWNMYFEKQNGELMTNGNNECIGLTPIWIFYQGFFYKQETLQVMTTTPGVVYGRGGSRREGGEVLQGDYVLIHNAGNRSDFEPEYKWGLFKGPNVYQDLDGTEHLISDDNIQNRQFYPVISIESTNSIDDIRLHN